MASDAMAAAMSPAELLEFLFLPAFSLKETTSAISGRGVGLDIVQQAIREQNGTRAHRVRSRARGFRTSITLPLTQSIVRALVVDVQGEAYAIPIVKVERVLKVPQSAISTLENKQFFDFGGEHLGLVSAAQVLELGQMEPGAGELSVRGDRQRRSAATRWWSTRSAASIAWRCRRSIRSSARCATSARPPCSTTARRC